MLLEITLIAQLSHNFTLPAQQRLVKSRWYWLLLFMIINRNCVKKIFHLYYYKIRRSSGKATTWYVVTVMNRYVVTPGKIVYSRILRVFFWEEFILHAVLTRFLEIDFYGRYGKVKKNLILVPQKIVCINASVGEEHK